MYDACTSPVVVFTPCGMIWLLDSTFSVAVFVESWSPLLWWVIAILTTFLNIVQKSFACSLARVFMFPLKYFLNSLLVSFYVPRASLIASISFFFKRKVECDFLAQLWLLWDLVLVPRGRESMNGLYFFLESNGLRIHNYQ